MAIPGSAVTLTYTFGPLSGQIPLSNLDTNYGQIVTALNGLFGSANVWTYVQTPLQAAATASAGVGYTWAVNTGQTLQLTFGAGNITNLSYTGAVAGTYYTLYLKQDGTGSRLISAYTGFKFPGGTLPTLSTGANAIDIFTFYYDGTSMCNIGQAQALA
jgi:hypothetical protein